MYGADCCAERSQRDICQSKGGARRGVSWPVIGSAFQPGFDEVIAAHQEEEAGKNQETSGNFAAFLGLLLLIVSTVHVSFLCLFRVLRIILRIIAVLQAKIYCCIDLFVVCERRQGVLLFFDKC